jgi:hypothetical protein
MTSTIVDEANHTSPSPGTLVRNRRPAFRVIVALLFALSSVAQQQATARTLLPQPCPGAVECGLEPHRLALGDAHHALATSLARLGIESLRFDTRGVNDGNSRSGVDQLFHVRSDLLLVRARTSLAEYRSAALTIHVAVMGTDAASSRAPPRIS